MACNKRLCGDRSSRRNLERLKEVLKTKRETAHFVEFGKWLESEGVSIEFRKLFARLAIEFLKRKEEYEQET
jgi:hypothetical protein